MPSYGIVPQRLRYELTAGRDPFPRLLFGEEGIENTREHVAPFQFLYQQMRSQRIPQCLGESVSVPTLGNPHNRVEDHVDQDIRVDYHP